MQDLASKAGHNLFDRYRLQNGLDVVLHRDDAAPVVTVNLLYRVGSRYEEPGKTGYAHLFEHLMFDGSANVPRGDYDRLCTLAGGENNAWTSTDFTNYWITVPAERLPLAVWLESDRLAGFGIEQISLDTQIGVVTAEKNQVVDNTPYGEAGICMREIMYAPPHPYRWEPIGDIADVSRATLPAIRDFYARYYQPSNACLVIAGDFDAAEARQLVDDYFGTIASNPVAGVGAVVAQDLLLQGGRKHLESPIVPFPAAFLSWHAPDLRDRRLPAYRILLSVLSDGESSRLYRTLEYETMVASESGAFLDDGELGSLFVMYAIGSTADIQSELLERQLRDVLEDVARSGITEQELQRVINRRMATMTHALQSISAKAERLAWFTAVANDPELAWKEVDAYRSLGVSEIRRAAEELMSREPGTLLYERTGP